MQVLYHEGPGKIALKYKNVGDDMIEREIDIVGGDRMFVYRNGCNVKRICNNYGRRPIFWDISYKFKSRMRSPKLATKNLLEWLCQVHDSLEYVIIYRYDYNELIDMQLPRSKNFFKLIRPLCSDETVLRLLNSPGFAEKIPVVPEPKQTILEPLLAQILETIPGVTVQENCHGWYYVYFETNGHSWGYAETRLNKPAIIGEILAYPASREKYEELILDDCDWPEVD